MVIAPSTFVVEYRVSNKRSPRRDISWWAYGLGEDTKPVWMIDFAFRWLEQVTHSKLAQPQHQCLRALFWGAIS